MAEIYHLQPRIEQAGARQLLRLLQDAAGGAVDLGPRGPHIMALVQSLDQMSKKLRQELADLQSLPSLPCGSTEQILTIGEEVSDLLDKLLLIAGYQFTEPSLRNFDQ